MGINFSLFLSLFLLLRAPHKSRPDETWGEAHSTCGNGRSRESFAVLYELCHISHRRLLKSKLNTK